ncbi:MAG: hypothetical protein ABFC63_00465 [Thermoguttaceae bacterium]
MTSQFRRCRQLLRVGRWLTVLVLVTVVLGCKEWQTHDKGLRDNGLSSTARKARAQKEDKDAGCMGLSDESREIERDLMGRGK